jgi:outer membrane protein OmpA-like peptidoglycan-associated protein
MIRVPIRPAFLSLVLLAVVPVPVLTQPATEHPVIKAMSNSVVSGRPTVEKYGEMQFRFKEGSRTVLKPVGGPRLRVTYDIASGSAKRDFSVSAVEIVRNYEAEALRVGGAIHARTQNRLFFSVPREGGGTTYGSLWASAGSYILDIVDQQPLQTSLTFGAEEMRKALAADGRVAVYGILFDLDRATLRGESRAVLDEVVKLLQTDPVLRLEVQGHTDATGSAERNRALSEKRAQAVVDALATMGIEGGRLTAKGYGADVPVADNATEDGRQKNRRVELVKQ